MKIDNTRKLRDLQRDFNLKFPHLKIEFYDQMHPSGQGSPEDQRLDPDLEISVVRTVKAEGQLVLDSRMTTGEFEQLLQECYGLNVQVFRQSYGKWMQTWATDVWTLREQNRRAEIFGDRGTEISDQDLDCF